jgi:CMP-N,N'-diacetyllegionaminic acid synthase
MSDERVLAVIPARGGSKGLPGKNIRPLMGLPLLVHSIRCAGMSRRVTTTVVSTDSEEIAEVARQGGASVPFMRPAELARDDTPMFPVLTHALLGVEAGSAAYDFIVLLDPTSPGRLPDEIDRAVADLLEQPTAVGVVACSRPTFNPFWVGVVKDGPYIAPAFGGANGFNRRQEVPPFYRINGALYVWRASHVRAAPAQWRDAPHLMLEMPEERAFSIDDLYEFRLAEAVLGQGLINLPWLQGVAP